MKTEFKDLKKDVYYNVSYPASEIELHNPHLCLHISDISGNAIFVDGKGMAKETNLANSHDMEFMPTLSDTDKFMYIIVDDGCYFSVRTNNGIKANNLKYVGDLVQKTENEMLKTPNFGRKSLNEIKEALQLMGVKFSMVLDKAKYTQEIAEKFNSENKINFWDYSYPYKQQ